jgi:UDP-GlcNAc:undecaprenyl-phosphate/decaprenyl-phosphate GlcNAc-1-phosphate transferase
MIRTVESCAIAFSLCALVTPITRNACIRVGIFDSPGPLKIHQRPIPRLGGIGITLAIVAGCAVGNHFRVGDLSPFLASLAIVWIVGLVDDVRCCRTVSMVE